MGKHRRSKILPAYLAAGFVTEEPTLYVGKHRSES
jgi:hypothetical protein